MTISLSDHFTYKKLITFVFPSIIMMIFTSIYSIVDGFFVSNYVGKTALASLNLITPALMIVSSFGFMMGTGGSAIIAKTLGEGRKKEANGYFSCLITFIFLFGVLVSSLGILFMPQIASFLKATEEMKPLSILYGRIMMVSLPFFMLQTSFQTLFVTAEKPKYGLYVTVGAGICNMILDFLLVGILKWGLAGAAIATASCEIIGGMVPTLYFLRKNNSSLLCLSKPLWDLKMLLKSAFNGSSEFVSQISSSLVGMIYNFQLLHFAQENGVAAYGAIMYVNFIFCAIFIGYSTGSAPLIGYNLGAQNEKELKNVFKKSIVSILSLEIIVTILSFLLSEWIMGIFVGYDRTLFEITVAGFHIYCIHYLLCGINIYTSSFFTALNNGKISAIISFMRSFIFQMGSLILLPFFFGLNGIWWAIVVAESFTFLLTLFCLKKYRKVYHY
ncbi:MAG: MATE family efflux transporter [Erysipelotrichaceae bacterium]|nr:MATE family efflux transporter [Erysipelotrichaceae bacterium]